MKISNKLWRKALLSISAGLLFSQPAISYAARCDYIIQSEWSTGFVASIRITNDTKSVIDKWSVNWAYSDGTKQAGGWNASFSGSNPYSASNVGWNALLTPGQTAEFGFQGTKGKPNSPAAKPVVAGAVCGTQSSSSVQSSQQTSSSRSFSSGQSSKSQSSVTQPISSAPKSLSSRSFSSAQSFQWQSSIQPTSFASRSSTSSRSSISNSFSSFSVPRSSSSRSFSVSHSTGPNLPVLDLKVTVQGLTVHVDTRGSTDVDGDPLYHTISFGDDTKLNYPNVWHTYKEPGTYMIDVRVSDIAYDTRGTIRSYPVTVVPATGNQAPTARLSIQREYEHILAYGSSSYDPEGTPLTYEWDFGNGSYVGDPRAVKETCDARLVTLTVSDGELKDTKQGTFGGICTGRYDLIPSAVFTYNLIGNTVFVDGSSSWRETGFNWDFGDGAKAVGLKASHTYTSAGSYDITLTTEGMGYYTATAKQSVVIGAASSRSSSSSFTSTSTSSLSSSKSSQSSSSYSSQSSSDRNHYNAKRASTPPIIDGQVDDVWGWAQWAPIDVFWLGTQPNPDIGDFYGRYKAMWDQHYLYILYEINDSLLYDGTFDPLDRYWEDDTVELFIDENRSGGQHGSNASAWAYHISTYGDVVDSITGAAKLLNNHIDVRRVSNGTQHYWEMRVCIYGENYVDGITNGSLLLSAGKLMGFSVAYIDNDGSAQRESMMGSVDTQGHKDNQGYLDASVFGTMRLVE